MTFLGSVSPSNATIFDSQSVQMNHLRKKMRSKGDQCHTLSYIGSISMPRNRHSTLKEALFVDIRVSTDFCSLVYLLRMKKTRLTIGY